MSLSESQAPATQPATYHAADDSDSSHEVERPVTWGRLFPMTPEFETIGAILGRNITLHHDPNRLRKVDKLVQVADISSLQAEIKWSPEIDFRTGITDLLKFEGLLP